MTVKLNIVYFLFLKRVQLDNPAEDEEAVGDPYKTLFVGRLPHSVTEADLRKEFGVYGALERVRVVQNKDGKSRGYAFLVFDREKDMKGMSLYFTFYIFKVRTNKII